MAVYESKNPTKDGRKYFFRIIYKDIFGEKHDYTSPKFKKRSEAIEEEAIYRTQLYNKTSNSSITIEQAFYELINNKKKKYKPQSIKRNFDFYRHLDPIKNVKINDLNLTIYKKWVSFLESENIKNSYRNKILCLFMQIITYSNKVYNTDNKIINFVEKYRENDIKEEMVFLH